MSICNPEIVAIFLQGTVGSKEVQIKPSIDLPCIAIFSMEVPLSPCILDTPTPSLQSQSSPEVHCLFPCSTLHQGQSTPKDLVHCCRSKFHSEVVLRNVSLVMVV